MILGAVAACIIDREFKRAAMFAAAGAALTFFGFVHGEAIGIGQSPLVALSYLVVGAILWSCALHPQAVITRKASEQPEPMLGTAD